MVSQKIRKGKRKWYPIHAPALFDKQLIGETMVWETEAILGKPVKVNLMTLTGNPKKQSMDAYFSVTQVIEGVGHTKALGIELQHNSARRLARRGRSKVADSFLAKTKDGELIRVKPIVMTRSRADNETQRAIRAKTKEVVRAFTSKYSIETLINEIVNARMQRYLKDALSAVFPVRSADIRFLKYEKDFNEEEGAVEEVEYELRKKNLKKETVDAMADLKDEVEALMAEEEATEEPAVEESLVAAVEEEVEEPAEEETPAEEAAEDDKKE